MLNLYASNVKKPISIHNDPWEAFWLIQLCNTLSKNAVKKGVMCNILIIQISNNNPSLHLCNKKMYHKVYHKIT